MERDAKGNLVMTKGVKAIIAVITILLVTAVILLSVFLGIYINKDMKWGSSIENNYASSYYSLMDSLNNMENSLTKLTASRSPSMQEEILLEVALQSQLAAGYINSFSYSGYSLEGLIKFTNQACDFAKYGIKKLQDGQSLDDKDMEAIKNIRSAVKEVNTGFAEIQHQVYDKNGKLMESLDSISANMVNIVENLNSAIKYPSLIYDGPFSEALEKKTAKYLAGKQEYNQEQAMQKAKEFLKKYNLTFSLITESNSHFDSYIFDFSGDKQGNIQVSKQGGEIVNFDIDTTVTNPIVSEQRSVVNAEYYCNSIGMKDMKAVWSTVTDSVVYVNLCYTKDDIIYYPDMVKVKVSMQTGEIVGFESLNYIYNHTQRELQQPQYTRSQIQEMDYGNMNIDSIRLTVIPTDFGTEVMAYELSGKMDEQIFFIYINAMTGKECKIMRVVDSDQGKLLM